MINDLDKYNEKWGMFLRYIIYMVAKRYVCKLISVACSWGAVMEMRMEVVWVQHRETTPTSHWTMNGHAAVLW